MTLTGSCAASAEDIRGRVDDLPGVVEVRVPKNGGEADIPFSRPAHRAKIVMVNDATAEQILAVFEALGDDVDDDDLTGIELGFLDDDSATLTTGASTRATQRMAEELVEARDDPDVVAYARTAAPVLREVYVELDDPGLEPALAAADSYLGRPDITSVTVVAGGFLLIRDRVNGRPALAAARERLALAVDREIGLTGAAVTGRGTLKLCATLEDVASVKGYLEQRPGVGDTEPVGVVAATAKACGDIYL
ncbi:hypothetical protein KLP28_10845 [Nocardioidaceae bacterium]|nr:hypothetical protein KLP28_10845 [Nocardioidaceae bacterium]